MAQMRRLPAWYRAAWKNNTAVCALLHAAIPAGFYAVWIIGLNPNRSYFFSEYTLKFVPFLRDAGIPGWFDAWAMGDPRPRPVAVMATVLNLRLREEWSHWAVLPPSLGISWLLYPLTLIFLYRALRRMRFDPATGVAACLLWGLSPPALDSLALCYVPAKALMNFWFVWALGNAALLDTGGPKAFRAAVRLAAALSLAWLTDETALIVMLVLVVVFAPSFLNPGRGRQSIARAWLSVTAPVLLFALIALAVYPLINRLAGQVPLDFPQTVVRGPSVAYQSTAAHTAATKMVSSHFTGMWAKLDPLGMAFTMLTAHLLPNREVPGFWTWNRTRGPADWPLDEAGAVCFFLAAMIALGARLPPERRQVAVRFAASIAALVLAYTILLVPLAPAILEVNYYGALFSMPFAMLLAILLFGSGREVGNRALIASLGVILVAALQAASYEATSLRIRRHYSNHEGFWNKQAEQSWDYGMLSAVDAQVRAGKFEEVVLQHPYPSRVFSYAFELEANRRHGFGAPVDYAPLAKTPRLFDTVLAQHNAWLERNGMELRQPELPSRAELLAQGGRILTADECRNIVFGSHWEGHGRDWAFTLTVGKSGEYVERRWLLSVMRVWQFSGHLSVAVDDRLLYSEPGEQPASLEIAFLNGAYYAVNSRGRSVFVLTRPGGGASA